MGVFVPKPLFQEEKGCYLLVTSSFMGRFCELSLPVFSVIYLRLQWKAKEEDFKKYLFINILELCPYYLKSIPTKPCVLPAVKVFG